VGHDALYATVLGCPEEDEVTVRTLSSNLTVHTESIGTVELLGADGALEWTRDETGLRVKLPGDLPCEHAIVLKIRGTDE